MVIQGRALDQPDHNSDKGAISALSPGGVHVEWAVSAAPDGLRGAWRHVRK